MRTHNFAYLARGPCHDVYFYSFDFSVKPKPKRNVLALVLGVIAFCLCISTVVLILIVLQERDKNEGKFKHDDVIKWKLFCVTGPLCGELNGQRWIPLTKANEAELWWFLWFAHEQTSEQTIETLVIAIAPMMTSLHCHDSLVSCKSYIPTAISNLFLLHCDVSPVEYSVFCECVLTLW